MKNTKLLTTVILICLIVFGVFALLLADNEDEKQEYETAVAQAKDYIKQELYQLAIAEYDKAIAIKDSTELRDSILEAYGKRYEESTTIINDYICAAESAVSAFPKNEEYYIILAKEYCRNDNYQAAYKALGSAKDKGIKSAKINELYVDVKYAFETKWYTYTGFKPCVSGLYPVTNSEMWGFIDENGDSKIGFDYTFVSQLGEEGIRILCSEKNILEDSNDIVRGKLSFVPNEAGIYSEGFIAIKNGEKYGFYNSLGEYKFGEFIVASNFANGKAAVSEKEGEWYFVDTSCKKVSDTTYQDVNLNLDGSYLKNGIMFAKIDGKYKMYDKDGKRINTFECDDVDVITDDGIIAFKKNDKWGFVDSTGKVIVEAKFDNAKSFSNGLAAVCQDEKWGFVDKTGSVVIDCQFFDADYFNSKRNCLVKSTPGDWQMIALKVKF